MLLDYWHRPAGLARLRDEVDPAPDRGVQAARLRTLLRAHGLDAFLLQGRIGDLEHELARGRPVLVGLVKPHGRIGFDHYELVIAVHPRRRLVVTLDPAAGWRQNDYRSFTTEWQLARRVALVAWAASRLSAAWQIGTLWRSRSLTQGRPALPDQGPDHGRESLR
jgi:hypothetical protein